MIHIAYSPVYILPLPANHRFPMLKYELIPQQLIHRGIMTLANFFCPKELSYETAALVHKTEYLDKLLSLNLSNAEIRRSGFPLTQTLIDREFIISGGTVECCDFAFKNGIAFNVAGGTHHAFADAAEGFCLLNDCAIASAFLLHQNKAKKILIIDLDVHQGNGTASIFKEESRVYTFSMHGAHNFPQRKEKSTLDVALNDGTTDDEYLSLLEINLQKSLEESQPDFAFYISGVDVLATDKLGRLKLSKIACEQRDRLVIESCKKNNLPLVVTMGGGYSEKINDIVDAHCATYRIAADLYD